MKKKHICIYVDHWSNGGEESYVMSLLRNWDLNTVDCEILTAQIDTDRYNQELQMLGVPIRTVLGTSITNPISRVWETCKAYRSVLALCRFDVIYMQMANGVTLYYCYVAKRLGIPVRVVHSHCAGIKRGRGYYLKKLAHEGCKRLFARMPTRRLACSGTAATWLYPKRYLPACEIISNGIEPEKFRFDLSKRMEVRSGLGLDDKFVLGTVGRCEQEKNQRFLLSLMNSLHKHSPDYVLLVVGEGSLLGTLQQEAETLGVSKQVIFYGASSDVPAMLCAMDLFLLPSYMEGNPISSIEAQTNGLICLLSDTISNEARLTPTLQFLPISDGVEPWVQAILRINRDDREKASLVGTSALNADVRIIADHVYHLLLQMDKVEVAG